MAKPVDSHVWRRTSQRYNWKLWSNGQKWLLQKPEDFDTTPQQLRTAAYVHCNTQRKKGINVRVKVEIVNAEQVVIWFYEPAEGTASPKTPGSKRPRKKQPG